MGRVEGFAAPEAVTREVVRKATPTPAPVRGGDTATAVPRPVVYFSWEMIEVEQFRESKCGGECVALWVIQGEVEDCV